MQECEKIAVKVGKWKFFKPYSSYEKLEISGLNGKIVGGSAETEEADIILSPKHMAVKLNKPTAVVTLINLETGDTVEIFSKKAEIILEDSEIYYKINKISQRDTILFKDVFCFEDSGEKIYVSKDNSVSVIDNDKFFLIYPRKNIEFIYNERKFNIIFKKKFSFFGILKRKRRFYF